MEKSRVQKWREANRERFNANARRYKAEHRDTVNAQQKQYLREMTPEQRLERARKKKEWHRDYYSKNRAKYQQSYRRSLCKKYGVNETQLDGRHKHQCAICGRRGNLHIDHCHERNVFRGYLCGSCNRAIGLFKDDISRLKAAICYLEKSLG